MPTVRARWSGVSRRSSRGAIPRDAWAFAERACGVCTTVHALASVRTVEDALGITVPPNAELVRNLMFCAQYMQDHVVHFYHLHALDWVDVVSALKADPAEDVRNRPEHLRLAEDLGRAISPTCRSGWRRSSRAANWGSSPTATGATRPTSCRRRSNLLAVAHYLEALEWQKEIVKIHTIFGGKNPHPNYLVGGMPCAINIDEANALNAERLAYRRHAARQGRQFVEKVYMPDLHGRGVVLQGLGGDRRRAVELPGLRRSCRPTVTATRRSSSSRAASSSTAT